jgi:ADP-ribose pyrophosphatase YjhB (NUDIX family)
VKPVPQQCRVHKLIADVTVSSGSQVLLVRYLDVSRYDGQRGWFLPDDWLDVAEHPDDAARRILRDQAGLELPVSLDHVESFGNGAWHLIFHYRAEIADPGAVRRGQNVSDARWFALDAFPESSEMAHDGWGREVAERVLATART